MSLTASEVAEIESANASGRVPVVFAHGLWLTARCWQHWRWLFESEGFATVAPLWPGEASTVSESRAEPGRIAGLSLTDLTRHHAEILARLDRTPVVVGHSLGALVAQQLAGRGRATTTVAVAPAPHRGVLRLPPSSLRSAAPVLRAPGNRRRAVSLTPEEFRYAFTNALRPAEAEAFYEQQAVPAPGRPLFELALANLNPATPARVETRSADRGPLLVLSGERDRVVPRASARATYRRQRRNLDVTEFAEVPGRGHSLVADGGWEQVAQLALEFAAKHASTD